MILPILWNKSALTNSLSLSNVEFHVLRGPRPQDAGLNLFIISIAVLENVSPDAELQKKPIFALIVGLDGDRTRATCIWHSVLTTQPSTTTFGEFWLDPLRFYVFPPCHFLKSCPVLCVHELVQDLQWLVKKQLLEWSLITVWEAKHYSRTLQVLLYFWTIVFLSKCRMAKCISLQMSFRAIVLWANLLWANVLWANVLWANVHRDKCIYGQMLPGQILPWINVVWANVYEQMSMSKCLWANVYEQMSNKAVRYCSKHY
jgi:hypothetical protein